MEGRKYDAGFYADIVSAEEGHFWFRHRAAAARYVFRKHLAAKTRLRLLEIGAGTCYMAKSLAGVAQEAEITCVDLNAQGLKLGKRNGAIRAAVADLVSSPFRVKFDLICMFDVLEHIADDREMLSAARENVSENGALMLTVPAGPSLWSDFDVVSGHHRRYTAKELEEKLERAGFRKVYTSHLFSFLVPLMRVSRKRSASGECEIEKDARQQFHPPAALNLVLSHASRLEMIAMKAGIRIPFGTSIIAGAVPLEKRS